MSIKTIGGNMATVFKIHPIIGFFGGVCKNPQVQTSLSAQFYGLRLPPYFHNISHIIFLYFFEMTARYRVLSSLNWASMALQMVEFRVIIRAEMCVDNQDQSTSSAKSC